ncbi:MAG TPA: hypothetical protein VH393_16505 [Ktedonobacterales bacterium]|jgi:hypothetical protein
MTTKADYTAEEWAQLTQAPLMATMAIVAADMSGPVGLVKEMMATVRTIQETAASTTAGELVKAISTDVIESQQKKEQKDQGAASAQPTGDATAQPATDAPAQPAVSSPDPMQSMKIDAKDPEEAKKKAVEGCVAAANIVTQKSPAEADEFKQWLMTIANRTAEAGKEGGFLGIGGTRVSEKEKTELAALASALGASAA